jgi:hypothetical protein
MRAAHPHSFRCGYRSDDYETAATNAAAGKIPSTKAGALLAWFEIFDLGFVWDLFLGHWDLPVPAVTARFLL